MTLTLTLVTEDTTGKQMKCSWSKCRTMSNAGFRFKELLTSFCDDTVFENGTYDYFSLSNYKSQSKRHSSKA